MVWLKNACLACTRGSSPALAIRTAAGMQKYRERAKSQSTGRELLLLHPYLMGGAREREQVQSPGSSPDYFPPSSPLGSFSPQLDLVFSMLSLTSKLKEARPCPTIAVWERSRLKCEVREPRFSNTYLQKYFSIFQYPGLFAACLVYKLGI